MSFAMDASSTDVTQPCTQWAARRSHKQFLKQKYVSFQYFWQIVFEAWCSLLALASCHWISWTVTMFFIECPNDFSSNLFFVILKVKLTFCYHNSSTSKYFCVSVHWFRSPPSNKNVWKNSFGHSIKNFVPDQKIQCQIARVSGEHRASKKLCQFSSNFKGKLVEIIEFTWKTRFI